MEANQYVSDLKAKICEKTQGLTVEGQKLIYKGRTMQDSQLLSDFNLEEGSKVYLLSPGNRASSSERSEARHNSSIEATMDLSDEHGYSERSEPRIETKFEVQLRQTLAKYFSSSAIDRILANLRRDIEQDVKSSSLDDLERLGESKLVNLKK